MGGHYTRDASADDVLVTVTAPTSDSISGGGWIEVGSAAGIAAPQTDSKARFTLNLQYDKSGTVKGTCTINFIRIVDGWQRDYELTAAVASLAILRTSAGGRAVLSGTGTVRDITERSAPVVLAQDAPLIITATDAGEPSPDDALSMALFKRDGGVWLASGWNGLRALEQPVREGNIVIHGAK